VNLPMLFNAVCLAQYKAMGNRFQDSSRIDTWGLFMMVVFIAVAIGGSLVVYRFYKWREVWQRESPVSLFYEVCDGHKLEHHQKKRLLRIAEENGLAHPVMLFLSPGVWDRESVREEPGDEYQSLKEKVIST
jgi:hypothetical protein